MFADPRWRGPVLENTHGVEKLYLKCLGVSSYDDQRQKALIACKKIDETEHRRLPEWQFLAIRTDGKRILFRSDYTTPIVQAVEESEWPCLQKANDFRAGPRRVDEKSKPNMFREGPRQVNFALPSALTANTDQVPYWYSRSLPPSAVAEPQQAQTTPANPEAGSPVAVLQQAQPTQVPQPSTPNNASAPGWSSN